MNPRENLLSLYRRTGYEFAPVEFDMCPALARKMAQAIGEGVRPAVHFGYEKGFARAGVPGPRRVPREEPDWRRFFAADLHPSTTFDAYGVAHEGGREGTHHLWRMHHPLAHADSLEQLQAYPWPEWDFADVAHMREAVEKAKAAGLPAMAGMACTVRRPRCRSAVRTTCAPWCGATLTLPGRAAGWSYARPTCSSRRCRGRMLRHTCVRARTTGPEAGCARNGRTETSYAEARLPGCDR